MFQRFLSIFRGGRSSAPPTSLSDPFRELPHPGNRELFAALKPFHEPKHHAGTYNAHPDVEERLDQLAPAGKIIKGTVYGFPVMANSHGLVFSWAKGRWMVLIKLGKDHHEAARETKGRINAEYGKNWIEFPAWWSPSGPGPAPEPSLLELKKSEWRECLRHWMQVSYDDSLKIGEDKSAE